MCLAVPARVVACLDNDEAVIDLAGIQKTISLSLLDDVQVGDFVIVHVGYAIGKLDPDEAQATLELLAEAAQSLELTLQASGVASA